MLPVGSSGAAVPSTAVEKRTEASPADGLASAAYARILRVCSFARLPASDAEDIAQDIWVWLIESGRSPEAVSPHWLAGVTLNYVRRYWRAQSRRVARESRAGSGPNPDLDIETRISFDEIERGLPGLESSLLRLLRGGATFAEASRRLRIPRGSSDYYRKLLYSHISLRLRAARARSGSAEPT
jgi:DNA-directed RNA polymerase specialized sigma24 family protein